MDAMQLLPAGSKFIPLNEISAALAAFAGIPWNSQPAQSGGSGGYQGVGGFGGFGQASGNFAPAPTAQAQQQTDIPQAPIFQMPNINIPAPAPLPTPVFNIQAPPQPTPSPNQGIQPLPATNYQIQGAPVPTNMQTHTPGSLGNTSGTGYSTPNANNWGSNSGYSTPNASTWGRI